MYEPQVRAVETARVPKGLEAIKPAELKSHLESGKIKAAQLSRVASSSDQIQGQLGGLIEQAATKVEQTHVDAGRKFGEVHAQRVIKDKEINDAKKDKKDLGKKERRLNKTKTQIERVKADEVDIATEDKDIYKDDARKLQSTVETNLQKVNKAKVEATEKETRARSEKESLGYGKALVEEWGKIPDNISSKSNKKALDGAMRVVDETSESLPTYYAGQEILTLRVQEQVKTDQPIEDSFYESAKALDKAVKATRREELRLARKIDRTVKDPALKTGRLTDTVRGSHVQEDLAIQTEAQRIIEELYAGAEISVGDEQVLGQAIHSAADRVRKLIEQPGFGKKTLDNSLLTTQALNEARESKEIIDPLRRVVYEHLSGKQRSVEDVLGCKINVVPDEKGRLIEIMMPKQQGEGDELIVPDQLGEWGKKNNIRSRETNQSQPVESKLFTRLVQIERAEDGLSKKLAEANPGDLIAVRTLSEALKNVGKERASLLKLANARINGVTTADGVRSGALKTKLGETAVKTGEAAGAAGIAAAVTYFGTPRTLFHLVDIPHIAGISGHIENARNIVATANNAIGPLKDVLANGSTQIKDVLNQMTGLAENFKGMSLNEVITAIQSGQFDKAKPTIDVIGSFQKAFTNISDIRELMQIAPDKIKTLVTEALKGTAGEQVAAQRDLVIGAVATTLSAASFSDVVRNIASAPGRAIKKLFNG